MTLTETVARKIAQARGADPDAPITTAAGSFEHAWQAYAALADELIALVQAAG